MARATQSNLHCEITPVMSEYIEHFIPIGLTVEPNIFLVYPAHSVLDDKVQC